jgi:hypothetical protein
LCTGCEPACVVSHQWEEAERPVAGATDAHPFDLAAVV